MNQQKNKLIVIKGTSGFPSLPSKERKQVIKESIDKKTLSRLKQKLAAATAIIESFNPEIRDCLGESALAYIGTSMNNVINLIEHEAGAELQDMDTEVDFKNSVVRALLTVAFEINEEFSAVSSSGDIKKNELNNIPNTNIVYLSDSNVGVLKNLLKQELNFYNHELRLCKEGKDRYYEGCDKDRPEETQYSFGWLNYYRDRERFMKKKIKNLEVIQRNLRVNRTSC